MNAIRSVVRMLEPVLTCLEAGTVTAFLAMRGTTVKQVMVTFSPVIAGSFVLNDLERGQACLAMVEQQYSAATGTEGEHSS